MKIACATCKHEMALDDVKVPPLPFKVKCTKCGTVIVVSQEQVHPPQKNPESTAAPVPESIPAPPKIAPEIQEFIVQELANIRRELFRSFQALFGRELKFQETGDSAPDGSSSPQGNALVCEPEPAAGATISAALKSLGYSVDHVRTTSDAVKKLENESFDLISTYWSFPDDPEGGRQIIARVNSFSSRLRRQIFLVVITPELKSSDPKSAFFYGVNLTLNSNDIPQMAAFIRDGIRSEQEQYQLYQRLSVESGESA